MSHEEIFGMKRVRWVVGIGCHFSFVAVEDYALADWAVDGFHFDEGCDVGWWTEVVPGFVVSGSV